MNLLNVLTRGLMRGDTNDFAVVAGRQPCVKIGKEYQPLTDQVPSEADVLEMLAALGGFAYIDKLGPDPSVWRTVEDSLGPLQITAARRQGALQARVVRQPAVDPASSSKQPVAAPASSSKEPIAPPASSSKEPIAAPASSSKEPIAPPVAPAAKPPSPAPMKESSVAQRPSYETPPATPVAKRSSPPPKRFDATWAATFDPRLETLLGEARTRGASDLHVVATRPALYRVGGELVASGPPIEPRDLEAMVMPSVPPRLLVDLEKDGSCDFAIEHFAHGRFRANVSRQRTGLKASLRLIGAAVPTLESLGLPDAIGTATHHHQGLIVVTGPTGHGKTSTLAAIVNLLNTETTHHIITVEDPIEYVHPRKKALISQREVGSNTRSFASALKASLREDPDVIVVGELRDTETVRMALSASETGHLVIATMNTPSASKTIDRLIDLFPPGDQPQVRMALAGGLRLIVSQRLVKSVDPSKVVVAAELLPGNIALWNLIRDAKTYQIPSLQQRGKSMGIIRLDDSLGDLVRGGKVSLEEARIYAESPDELTFAVTGRRPQGAGQKAP
jgi:twitching motility protein PilT